MLDSNESADVHYIEPAPNKTSNRLNQMILSNKPLTNQLILIFIIFTCFPAMVDWPMAHATTKCFRLTWVVAYIPFNCFAFNLLYYRKYIDQC
jgi:hypothetical protein